ncbi:MAG: DUF2953 domain-containing protein [Spirochaeta sp.]|nr:DUF2953 domain-containing protein [Spirochaeta sp.]
MLPILAWVAATVAALILAAIALILVLLAVPVEFRAMGDAETERATLWFRWLFGAVRVPLTGRTRDHEKNRRRTAKHPTAKRHTSKKDSEKRPRRPKPSEIPMIFDAAQKLLPRVLRRFTTSADADVHFGLDDPADTGLIWGVTAPFLLRYIGRAGIRVRPVFSGAALTLDGRVAVNVVPVTVAVPLLQFFFSRDGRMTVRILRGRS